MENKLTVHDLNFKDKKVLIRVDFNVPIEKGHITDDTRIRASLPTIQFVLNQGGAVILMSHMGRPKGQINPNLTLAPCAKRLSELLERSVKMAPDCIGQQVESMVQQLHSGEILLLENLRFHKGEENPKEEPDFASKLASLGQIYINDAFGAAHRAHASTTIVAQYFPGSAAAGLLIEKEIQYLGHALFNPKRPFCAILGGSKISTKFKVIEKFLHQADVLLIGGAMAYTFFKAQGIAIGHSLYEEEFLEKARQLLDQQSAFRCHLLLPVDLVIARQVSSQAETQLINVKDGIPEGFEGVDCGPKTIELYKKELQQASTVFWNGPLGVFECPPFDKGTNALAQVVANLKATTIVGGGDSVAAIEKVGLASQISHLSTGGGASLEYIEKGQLPGIEALSNKNEKIK